MQVTIGKKKKSEQRVKLLERVKDITFTSYDFISMQLKKQLEPKPRQHYEHHHRKRIFLHNILASAPMECPEVFNHDYEKKGSRETTASGFTSLEHSTDLKRGSSIECPEKQCLIKDYIRDLKNKGNQYTIKWRTASKITKAMRVVLGQWLMQVAQELEMPKNTVFNAMHYVDKYTGLVNVKKNQYQQVGLCALFIASKLELSSHPRLETFLETMDGASSKCQLIQLEQKMVIKLKFRLNPPTLHQYMILLVSLFSHFQDAHFYGFSDVSKHSYLWNNIFYTLDAILLDDSYKSFHNKEKVCLTILYINMKKEKAGKTPYGKKKLIHELENLNVAGDCERNMELFMEKLTNVPLKIGEFKEYIKAFRKWVRYEVSEGANDPNYEQLKSIVLKEI